MTDIAAPPRPVSDDEKRLHDQREEYRQKIQIGRALDGADEATKQHRINMLARLIFAEAANHYETEHAMEGVGWAAVNRIGRPGFQKTLEEEVIYKPKQFAVGSEMWNKAADPSKLTGSNVAAYAKAREVAGGILSGKVADPTKGAPFFFSSPDGKVPGTWFKDQLKDKALEYSLDGRPVGQFYFLKPSLPQ